MSSESLILLGGGGHCRSVIDVLETAGQPIAGIVDKASEADGSLCGYPVLGDDDLLPTLAGLYSRALVTVGQIKTAETRRRLFLRLKDLGFMPPVVVSPKAHVSTRSSLGEGTVVLHLALINSGARIGVNCIVNSRALVEHDAVLGDNCHIATGAAINGGVTVGEGTFIGSGTVCREGITIGPNCLVGMGAVLRHDLPPGSRFF